MRLLTTTVSVLVLILAGCSDDNGTTPDTGTPDLSQQDGGVDQLTPDQGPPPGPLTVTVLKADNIYDNDFTTTPAVGATVAADLPGGVREEQTIAADGKVIFKDVPWAKGTAAVTAFLKGYRLHSIVGLTATDGDQTLFLAPHIPKPETVEISGTAKNPDPTADYLIVSAEGTIDLFQLGNTLSFKVQAPKNKAGMLLGIHAKLHKNLDPRIFALEAVAWTKADIPATATPATVDLDFANKETTTPFTTTFELPTGPKSLVGTASRPQVYVFGRNLPLAIPTKTTMDSATKFTIEAEYVKLVPETEVVTQYFVFIGNDGYGSYVIAEGYPKDSTVKGFPEVSTLTSPANPNIAIPFYERFRFENPEPAMLTVASIIDEDRGQFLWIMRGPKGATSLAFPQPPSTATAADVFGAGPVYGQAGFVADWNIKRLQYMRFSNGKRFALDPTLPTTTCVDKTYDNRAYKFCQELPWAGGEWICKSHGMRLAKVDDAKENDWIKTTATAEGMDKPEAMGLWLGGSDRDSEGTWAWPDGEVFYAGGKAKGYANFKTDEPNNSQGTENCLVLWLDAEDAGLWNDGNCSGSKYVVCEKY